MAKQILQKDPKMEKLQQHHRQLQAIDQQMRQLQENLMHLDRQRADMVLVQQTLDDIQQTKLGSEVLMPVSSGIFVKAELKNNTELVVNVGSNTLVERTVDETKRIVTDQMGEIKKLVEELEKQLQSLAEEGLRIEKEIRAK